MCACFRPNEDFYKQFGSVMLRRYANVSGSLPDTAAEAFAAGVKPTFQQFITYLLDPETEKESIFNEHWRQVFVSLRLQQSEKPALILLQLDFWDDWSYWIKSVLHLACLNVMSEFLTLIYHSNSTNSYTVG